MSRRRPPPLDELTTPSSKSNALLPVRMSSPNMIPASDSHAPSLSSSASANTSSPYPATPSSDNIDNTSRENVETTNPIQEKRRSKKTSEVEDEVREVDITLPEC
ncbi:uncharacterized protein A4U43_C01F22040 [Asparagus officinalis]|uniref:Uncharacterized protein n=1 Tax=Asparagus officinalis TaxID=4686 RepID=A0A5P1FRU1_ASPOF|nr:uncharacterized protein A4U43_C01F22040 [Asparagus officinalis]